MSINVASYVTLSTRYFEWYAKEFPAFGTTLVEGSEWEVLHVDLIAYRLLIARAEDNYLHWMWVNTDLVDKVIDIDSD